VKVLESVQENNDEEKVTPNAPLSKLALEFFRFSFKQLRKEVQISHNVEIYDTEGRNKYKFDLIIVDKDTNDTIGVWIKDWKRSVGVNVLTKLITAKRKTGITMCFLIANKVAASLKSREKENIFVIHRGEIVSMLRKLGYWDQDGNNGEDIIRNLFDK